MSEKNVGKTETARGGCLDAIVGIFSFGYFGVETTVTYPARKIKPSRIPTDGSPFPIEEGTPLEIAIRERGSVIINDFEASNNPEVNRRIVRNKRLI